ncbi:hypothetical protein [Hoeflea phototrophica]|uniref:hypothetical protein n=1 Tax=Hoeflea phototrophica TaxID=244596 RepID=UPI001FD9B0BA|nr:hypothetical protein [Hoeflea phototrophica]
MQPILSLQTLFFQRFDFPFQRLCCDVAIDTHKAIRCSINFFLNGYDLLSQLSTHVFHAGVLVCPGLFDHGRNHAHHGRCRTHRGQERLEVPFKLIALDGLAIAATGLVVAEIIGIALARAGFRPA